MSDQTTLSAIGLHTSENELGSVPQGGLVKAENCVMLAPGLIGSRRGQASVGYALASNGNAGFVYDDTLLVHSGTTTLSHDTGSAFTAYSGSYTAPDATLLRMKGMTAQDNFYFNTTAGVYRLDSTTGTPVLAGGPTTREISSGAVNATSGGFLAASSSVAYRVVFGFKDANGLIHLGPPSGRCVVTNSSTTTAYNVALTFPTYSGLTTEYFWQLYRSAQFPSSTTPGDVLKLVAEAYFTSTQLTAGSVSWTDTSPDDFLGTPLYTNSIGGNGILQANDAPPFCKDLTYWNDCAWYANTKQPESMLLQILGCGTGTEGGTGIRLNDALLLSWTGSGTNFAYYIASTSNTTVSAFNIFTYTLTTGGSDAGANIEATARSLVSVINQSNVGLRATYVSGIDDAPGRILIQATTLTRGTIYARVFPTGCETTLMTRTLGTTVTVDCSTPHGLTTGDTVYLSAASPSGNFAEGSYTVASTPTTSQFTYSNAGVNTSTATVYTVRRVSPVQQYAWNPPPPPSLFSIAIGGLVRTGGSTVTATCESSHLMIPGMVVDIQATLGVADANFAVGTKTVVTTPTATTFTYTESGSNTTSTVAYQSGARVVSDNEEAPERIYFSKIQEPEAVPTTRYLSIGTKGKPILRAVPLGESLFVFKDEGVWTISGNPGVAGNGSLRVDLLDDTVHLYAPDSVVPVSGKLYALTNQGVVAVTSSGARIVSGPIEQDLFQYFGPTLSSVKLSAFGVSHETDRLYSLWLPALSGASAAPYNVRRAYVYSTLANAWTTWELERNWGIVRASDDKLYMGGLTTAVYAGRNTKTAADYADGTTTLTINTASPFVSATNTLTVASTTGVSAGDAITDSAGSSWIVTSVPSATTVILSGSGTFSSPTQATGTITMPVSGSGNLGASINSNLVTVPWNTSATQTAEDLRDAINADATVSALVTATAASGVVTLTATTTYVGTAGNAITLIAWGTGVTVSGATLSGGANVSITAYAAIPIELKWRSFVAGSPADIKIWDELQAHFRLRQFYKGTFSFTTDLTTTAATVNVYPTMDADRTVATYTATTTTYPGMPVEPKKSRILNDRGLAQGAYLNVEWDIDEAFALWWLNGITLIYEKASHRSQRA